MDNHLDSPRNATERTWNLTRTWSESGSVPESDMMDRAELSLKTWSIHGVSTLINDGERRPYRHLRHKSRPYPPPKAVRLKWKVPLFVLKYLFIMNVLYQNSSILIAVV